MTATVIDDVGYDPDLFDAEILVERKTTRETFTTDDLCDFFNRHRVWVYKQMRNGMLERPETVGNNLDPSRWTRQQVIRCVAKRLEAGLTGIPGPWVVPL